MALISQNQVMYEIWSTESLGLLDQPSPAVLATYRRNGSAAVSPVLLSLPSSIHLKRNQRY